MRKEALNYKWERNFNPRIILMGRVDLLGTEELTNIWL